MMNMNIPKVRDLLAFAEAGAAAGAWATNVLAIAVSGPANEFAGTAALISKPKQRARINTQNILFIWLVLLISV
jgi:hypothetical protein